MALNTSNPKESGEISLKDLIENIKKTQRYLFRRWKIILAISFLGGIAGYGYAYLNKPLYIATTSFVLEDNDNSGGGGILSQLPGLASLTGSGAAGGMFQGDNIIELYKSRSMIQNALLSKVDYQGKEVMLINMYADINQLTERWKNNQDSRSLNFDDAKPLGRWQDSILQKAVDDINKKYLSVSKRDKKLAVIDVEVKATNEVFAKSFNNQIVKTVNDFYVKTKAKKAMQNFLILQHQTDSVRSVLNGAIYQSASVNDATPNLNPTRQILRAPALRYQYNADANKAILTQLIQNLELSKITLRKETPLLQILDEPIYPLEKHRMSRSLTAIGGGAVLGFLASLFLIVRKAFHRSLSS